MKQGNTKIRGHFDRVIEKDIIFIEENLLVIKKGKIKTC